MINNAKLADLYAHNPAVRAILEHFAQRVNNSNMNLVKRIQVLLKGKGVVFSWREFIAAFRLLQEAGCGTFVKGSRGYSSRFYWEVKSRQALSHALEASDEQDDEEDEEEEDSEEDDEDFEEDGAVEDELLLDPDVISIRHSFVLRVDLKVFLQLPPNLTRNEANRLAQFTETLSFADPYGDEPDEAYEYDDDEIMHTYELRQLLRVTLRLPENLTPHEASRLADFIRVLSFAE